MRHLLATSLRLLVLGLPLAFIACSQQESEPAATAATSYNYDTSLDMASLMTMVIEPAADTLWDNAGWIESAAGYEELYPTTEEGWDFMEAQSAVVAESGNLLALPGRVIDNDAWLIYAQGLAEAGQMALDAAERRHEEDFFQAGAQIYNVCRACHQSYNPDIVSRFVDGEPQ